MWGDESSAQAYNACPQGGALGIRNGVSSGRPNGNYTTVGWLNFNPGEGLTLKRAKLLRSFTLQGGFGTTARGRTGLGFAGWSGYFAKDLEAPASPPAAPSLVSVGDAGAPLAATNRMDLVLVPYTEFGLAAECVDQVQFEEHCDARVALFSSDVVLDDTVAPVGSVESPPFNGALAGVIPIKVAARDVGAGVAAAWVEVAGHVVARSDSRALGVSEAAQCLPADAGDGRNAYLVRKPCPAAITLPISWDTSATPSGTHDARVVVEDAAGNRTTVSTGRATIVAGSPVGPASPAEFRGDANGAVAAGAGSGAATISLGWASSARAPSVKPAVVARCKSTRWAAAHPVQCVGRAAQDHIRVDWAVAGQDVLRGHVIDGSGAPLGAARIEILGIPGANPGTPVSFGVALTDVAGDFQMPVPRANGTVQVEARWSARVNDTVPAAIARAQLEVRAPVALNAFGVQRAGSVVAFAGTIPTLSLPVGGRTVSLQVFERGKWATFAEPQVGADGAWVWHRRLKVRGTYKIRVLVRSLPGSAFVESASRVRVLRVR